MIIIIIVIIITLYGMQYGGNAIFTQYKSAL